MKTIEKIGIICGIGILIYLIAKYTIVKKPTPTPTPTQPTYPTIPTQPQKYIKSITIKPEKATVYVNEPLYIDYEITPNEGVEPPETIMGELIMMRAVNILSPDTIKTPKPVVKEVILNPNGGRIELVFDRIYSGTGEDKYNIRLFAENVSSNIITITVKMKIQPPPSPSPSPTTPFTTPFLCISSDPPSDPPSQNEILHNVV